MDTESSETVTSPDDKNQTYSKTVVSVVTGGDADFDSIEDNAVVEDYVQDLDESGHDVPDSVLHNALTKIVLVKKEKGDEMIEVDVELEEEQSAHFYQGTEVENPSAVMNNTDVDGIEVICGKCDKRFNNILSLEAHLKLHTRVKNSNEPSRPQSQLPCTDCELTFLESSDLMKHMYEFHQSESEKLHGNVTVKKEIDTSLFFASKNVSSDAQDIGKNSSEGTLQKQTLIVSLKNMNQGNKSRSGHKKSDVSEDGVEKQVNGNLSKDAVDDYLRFMNIDEKPLIIHIIKESSCCKICGETFSDDGDLQAHEKLHEEEKTFKCQKCDEDFPTYFSMLGHMRMCQINGDNESLICKLCSMSFFREKELVSHMNEHLQKLGRQKYTCPICSKNFTHKHSLKNHLPLHNGTMEHKCTYCGKTFPCASSLNRHVKTHNTVKQFFCDECDKGFKDSYALKKHVRIHSADRPYVCQECGATFRTQSTLSAHTVVHTKIKPFPCNNCGKKFSFRSDLNRHMKLHSGVKPHQCDICMKSFFEKSRMIIHRRIHTGEKPYSCSECGETFISSRNLARHMKNHNPTFICTVCNKTYVDAYTLKVHMYKHTGEKPHACSQCPKKFRTQALLKKHENTHTGVKPYMCEDCGRGFTSALNLKNHKTLHTGERPFECTECDKCFPTEATLKVHMQFHGEKSHFCEQCGKGFHRIYELNLHVITHAPQKPFSCELCTKTFCHKATYKAHMNTHTEETKYPCPECGKIFLRSNTLRKHMNTHAKARARLPQNAVSTVPNGLSIVPADIHIVDGYKHLQQSEYYEEYLCTECGNTFPDTDSLRKHLIEEHAGWQEGEVGDEAELIVEEVSDAQPVEVQT